jgi:hypothetical protein
MLQFHFEIRKLFPRLALANKAYRTTQFKNRTTQSFYIPAWGYQSVVFPHYLAWFAVSHCRHSGTEFSEAVYLTGNKLATIKLPLSSL